MPLLPISEAFHTVLRHFVCRSHDDGNKSSSSHGINCWRYVFAPQQSKIAEISGDRNEIGWSV